VTERIWTNPCWCFSFLTWIIGKIFDVNGYLISGIVFETVSKISGKRQYTASQSKIICLKETCQWLKT